MGGGHTGGARQGRSRGAGSSRPSSSTAPPRRRGAPTPERAGAAPCTSTSSSSLRRRRRGRGRPDLGAAPSSRWGVLDKQSGELVSTNEETKWIFVLSTSRSLYVEQKRKGRFQHSSFLSGAATTAAGRLVAKEGVLRAIWPYIGHYHPTEENFMEFIAFLEENSVDLTNVKRCSVDDDEYPSFKKAPEEAEAAANGKAPVNDQPVELPVVDIVKEGVVAAETAGGGQEEEGSAEPERHTHCHDSKFPTFPAEGWSVIPPVAAQPRRFENGFQILNNHLTDVAGNT